MSNYQKMSTDKLERLLANETAELDFYHTTMSIQEIEDAEFRIHKINEALDSRDGGFGDLYEQNGVADPEYYPGGWPE